jgi:hypothetical protein
MVYHGHFEYTSLYEMPVQNRTFYYRKLINFKQKEQELQEKAQGKVSETSSRPNISRGPAINKRQ